MTKNIKSFTIMEVIIVIVLVSILATFALPNYGKAGRKGVERAAITNLMTIRTAVDFYLINTGDTVIGNWVGIDAINSALGISVIDPKMSYMCGAAGAIGSTNFCSATHPSINGWALIFHQDGVHNTDRSIHCRIPFLPPTGACPSCPNGGSGDCG